MRRLFNATVGSPNFGTGETWASLYDVGKWPVFRDSFMTSTTVRVMAVLNTFKKEGGIPSEPAAFPVLREFRIHSTFQKDTG